MTSEQTQNTRPAAEVVADELRASYVGYVENGWDDWLDDARDVIRHLVNAGYTIAGPGQYVIDGGDTLRLALKSVCCDRLPGTELRHVDRLVADLMDALPTREGE
jgi:hypothetical protein